MKIRDLKHLRFKRFKRTHRIISRNVNKSIIRNTEDKEKLKVNAENFINEEAKPRVTQYVRENFYDWDQSGFQLEIHSGRTLGIEGTRQIE